MSNAIEGVPVGTKIARIGSALLGDTPLAVRLGQINQETANFCVSVNASVSGYSGYYSIVEEEVK